MLEYPPSLKLAIDSLENDKQDSPRLEEWRLKALSAGRRVLTKIS
jgi:hypothetical protein